MKKFLKLFKMRIETKCWFLTIFLKKKKKREKIKFKKKYKKREKLREKKRKKKISKMSRILK
jgi:hypothetical protein